MTDQPMQGRVALVAGASRGIGAVTARAFAAAGASVVLGSRDVGALESVANDIQAGGGRAVAVQADVTDVDSMQALVGRAVTAYGRLDYAFNNAAGGPMPAPLADLDPAEFDLGIATNIRGTFLGMKFQIGAMLASGGGAIVNMASVAGVNGTANLAAYVAGKAGWPWSSGPAGASAPSPLRRSRRPARRLCWALVTSVPWNPWRATSKPAEDGPLPSRPM